MTMSSPSASACEAAIRAARDRQHAAIVRGDFDADQA